jgi:hypothetical protein
MILLPFEAHKAHMVWCPPQKHALVLHPSELFLSDSELLAPIFDLSLSCRGGADLFLREEKTIIWLVAEVPLALTNKPAVPALEVAPKFNRARSRVHGVLVEVYESWSSRSSPWVDGNNSVLRGES